MDNFTIKCYNDLFFTSGKFPFNEYTPEDLSQDEYFIKALKKQGFTEVHYWYGYGSYEGGGEGLAKKDGEWKRISMWHCSCYSPDDFTVDDFDPSDMTKELEQQLGYIIEAINLG